MDKIDNIFITRILTQAYDFDGFTTQEVWSRIAQRMNTIIEHFNFLEKTVHDKQELINQKLEYLLDNGVSEEVSEKILELISDGTISNLINEELLGSINSKIDLNYDTLDNKINDNINTIINNINSLKNEINNTISQNNNQLETKINDNLNNVNKIKNRNATNDLINTNTSSISCNSSTYTFSVKEDKNMQSICYVNGMLYVGFALDDDTNGLIIKYDLSGKEIARSSNIAIGHCSSMSYDKVNDKLYITNGGSTNTKVYIVNPSTFNIEQTLDFTNLGKSALITIDSDNNKILHVGASDTSSKTFYKINKLNEYEQLFVINNLGTPQGLAIHYNSIFYLTNNGIYEIDFEGTIINTITLYNDNSEPQGLTIGQLNGTNVLMYGKNKYNSDTNVNTIYSITNLEGHKKTSLRMIGSYSSKENSSIFLSPVMINLSVRKINGTWTHMDWTNMISSSDNIVKEITAGMNSSLGYYDVTIKLNVKLHSYAQCIVTAEQSLFIDGYAVHGQLDKDGQTIHVRFKKSDAAEIIDPNTLEDGHGIIVTLIGGMKI